MEVIFHRSEFLLFELCQELTVLATVCHQVQCNSVSQPFVSTFRVPGPAQPTAPAPAEVGPVRHLQLGCEPIGGRWGGYPSASPTAPAARRAHSRYFWVHWQLGWWTVTQSGAASLPHSSAAEPVRTYSVTLLFCKSTPSCFETFLFPPGRQLWSDNLFATSCLLGRGPAAQQVPA